MEKILLDTNLLIYKKDHKIVNKKILKLTKILYDSNNYKLVIHPMSIEELDHMKNQYDKEVIISRI